LQGTLTPPAAEEARPSSSLAVLSRSVVARDKSVCSKLALLFVLVPALPAIAAEEARPHSSLAVLLRSVAARDESVCSKIVLLFVLVPALPAIESAKGKMNYIKIKWHRTNQT
jgi:hypothetical protein